MMNESQTNTELMEKAMSPRLCFGRDLIEKQSAGWQNALVITMPEVWEQARPLFKKGPAHLHFVESMDQEVVEAAEARLPASGLIVGIGGGMALDMAKYAAWKKGAPFLLVPSIASVDACVTNTIAIRDKGRVRYVGFVVPEAVLSDFTLMEKAAPRLNRAGIGDILSIHTGSFDWKLAASRNKDNYDKKAAAETALLVDGLETMAGVVRQVTDEALEWLVRAYAAENRVCLQVGHSRPEEGSEHYFCYNLEYLTGKGFVHGEIVCLGVLLMSRLQENRPHRVARILEETGVRYQPADLGISKDEIFESLLSLPDYVRSESLPYSIINEREPGEELIKHMTADLEF